MKTQISHVSIHQSAKVVASTFTLIVFVFFALPMALYSIASHGNLLEALVALIVIPIFYWIIFYLTHAFMFWLYNLMAKKMGGIEIELKDQVVLQERIVNPGEVVPPNRGDTL